MLPVSYFSPRGRAWRKPAYEVINIRKAACEIDFTCFGKYFRCRAQRTAARQLRLRNGFQVAGYYAVDCFDEQLRAFNHKFVVQIAGRVGFGNGHAFLHCHIAGVYVVAQEKSGYTAFGVAVDYGPVNRRRSAILRKE